VGPLVWPFLRDNIKLAALLYYNDEIFCGCQYRL
jgi:hypothetical protein